MTSPEVELAGELRRHYAQPHRRYHDMRHLAAVLAHVDELATDAADAGAVRLAAWFHDAVYDPTRTDNEAASAQLARTLLADRPPELVTEVVRLVLLTRDHDPEPGDGNGAVLCDADLAVLGSDPSGYASYASDVRAEYSHVEDDDFAQGRTAVLRRLLERPQLFRTERGRRRWEDAARRNISAELARLDASGGAAPPR
jgi:predicted metal-dependent HD superfamily phosphohydrolase